MMKEIFDYTIPVFHPFVVHLPVALLPVALVTGIIWVVRPNQQWGSVTVLLIGLAAIGSLLAFFTGDTLYSQSEGVPVVELFVARHRQLGRLVMIGAVSSFLLSLSSLFLAERPSRAAFARLIQLVFVVLVAISTVLVILTAHLGGIMVWGKYGG